MGLVVDVDVCVCLCVSLAVCTFTSRSDTEWYVVVGTAKDLSLSPRACSGGSLLLFKFSPDASKLEHVHTVRWWLDWWAYRSHS